MAATANYGWVKPAVGGDNGAWGTELNADLDAIDTQVKATDTTAQAALPKAGGLMTGRLDAKTTTVTTVSLGNVSGNPVNLDNAVAEYFIATLNGAATFAFTNVPNPANSAHGLLLELTNGSSAAVTWPASVKWPSGAAPALSAAGVDLIAFITRDGGTTWRAFVLAKDLR
jgi:hypothetical protein